MLSTFRWFPSVRCVPFVFTVQEDPEMRAMREKQERYVTQIVALDRVVEQWQLDVVLVCFSYHGTITVIWACLKIEYPKIQCFITILIRKKMT